MRTNSTFSQGVYVLLFYLLCLTLVLLNIFNCAMIPGVDTHRIKKITEGPEFRPYYGLKKSIAVFDFENESLFGTDKLGSAFADMLITQLMRSNRFVLVERSRLDKILNEQALGQSGIITEETAAQVGKTLGVDVIIVGRILDMGQKTGAHDFDNEDDKWKLALKATVGFAKVSYRVISTTTGEIIFADHFSTSEIKPGFGIQTKEFDFENMFDFDQNVVGIALRKAVNKIALSVVNNSNKISWLGKVIQTRADTLVYFKPGQGAGIRVGQIFGVTQNFDLNDSPIRNLLKSNSKSGLIAKIQVTGFIGDQVSRAKVIQGGNIRRGDLIKPEAIR